MWHDLDARFGIVIAERGPQRLSVHFVSVPEFGSDLGELLLGPPAPAQPVRARIRSDRAQQFAGGLHPGQRSDGSRGVGPVRGLPDPIGPRHQIRAVRGTGCRPVVPPDAVRSVVLTTGRACTTGGGRKAAPFFVTVAWEPSLLIRGPS